MRVLILADDRYGYEFCLNAGAVTSLMTGHKGHGNARRAGHSAA